MYIFVVLLNVYKILILVTLVTLRAYTYVLLLLKKDSTSLYLWIISLDKETVPLFNYIAFKWSVIPAVTK